MDVRIHDLLVRARRGAPARVGATIGDEARTFAELDAGANRAAHRLIGRRRAARRPGRVVGPDACSTRSSSATASARRAPRWRRSTRTSPSRRPSPRSRRWQPRLVVAHPDVADAAHAATDPLGVPIVVMHDGWTEGAAARPPRVGDGEDPSVVFLTSGSTGVSKGAMISHRAAWLRAVQRDSENGATQRRGAVVMFGLFHMSGWSMIEARGRSTDPCTW